MKKTETRKTGYKRDPKLKKLIEAGIPLFKIELHAAANNAWDMPETYFCEASQNPSRRCEMVLTPIGVICTQDGYDFGIPEATVKYYHFK